MTKLCIKKFKQGNIKPLTTVSIPLAVIKMVKSLIPKKANPSSHKQKIINTKFVSYLLVYEESTI